MRMRGTFFVGAVLVAACSDPNALPPPTISNVVDTVDIFALDGTPVNAPSGFSVANARPVRTDQFNGFDFAFNLTPAGAAYFLPARVLGLPEASLDPGLLGAGGTFESHTLAPFDGYVTDDSIPVAAGSNLLVRSRIVCSIGVPLYGKLEVLAIDADPAARTITIRFLVNQNCGYRGLNLGLPTE